jgi:hypothetical protein
MNEQEASVSQSCSSATGQSYIWQRPWCANISRKETQSGKKVTEKRDRKQK